MFMGKRAISLTLEESNLVWLRGVTARSGARSLSETVDDIVSAARHGGSAKAGAIRSVVGTIDIDAGDDNLELADATMRALFDRSLTRPYAVKETKSRYAATRRTRRG